MLGLYIKIFNFIYAVFKGFGKKIFHLYQEKNVLQYIKNFWVYKKSIMEETCKVTIQKNIYIIKST